MQIKEVPKYKLQKYRNTNNRNTEIQTTENPIRAEIQITGI